MWDEERPADMSGRSCADLCGRRGCKARKNGWGEGAGGQASDCGRVKTVPKLFCVNASVYRRWCVKAFGCRNSCV